MPATASGRWRACLAPAGVTLIALALASYRLAYQSYWDDEISTIAVCKAGLLDRLIAIAFLDVSPPLYYVLFGFWVAVSDREAWTRAFSVLMAVLSVPVTFAVGLRTVGRRAAGLGCILLSVLPLAVYCAQEARPYAFFHLSAVLLALALLRGIERPSRGRMVIAGLAGAGVLYAHYYGLFVLAGMGAWALWRARRFPDAFRRWDPLRAALLSVVLFLPWLPAFLLQLRGGQGWRPHPGVIEVLQKTLVYFTTGHTPRLLPTLVEDPQRALLWGTAIGFPLLVLVAAGLVSLRRTSAETEATPGAAALLVFWFLVPLALLLVATRLRPIFNERALLGFYVPVALLAGRAASAVHCWRKAVGFAAVGWTVVHSLLSLSLYYFDPLFEKQNWRDVALRIAAEARPGDAVLFHHESRELGLRYYLRGRVPVEHVFRWIPPEELSPEERTQRIEATAARMAATYRRIWLVDYHGVAFDRAHLLEARLVERFVPVRTRDHYEGVYAFRITLYERKGEDAAPAGG